MFKWADKKVKKMRWTDLQFVKLAVFAFAMMIAILLPATLTLDWYWYLIVGVIVAVRPLYLYLSDDSLKKIRWYDVALLKLCVFVFTLLVAKYCSNLLLLDWYWYLIIAVLASIRPLKQIYSK